MRRLFEIVLSWLQGLCKHPDYAVKADILEGESTYHQVQWCEKCGAFRFHYSTDSIANITYPKPSQEWRRAQPLWTK